MLSILRRQTNTSAQDGGFSKTIRVRPQGLEGLSSENVASSKFASPYSNFNPSAFVKLPIR